MAALQHQGLFEVIAADCALCSAIINEDRQCMVDNLRLLGINNTKTLGMLKTALLHLRKSLSHGL